MKFTLETSINKPIEDVWKIWAVEFDKAQDWLAAVPKSHKIEEGTLIDGAPMQGRICQLSNKENGLYADERITLFDKENHKMNILVIPKNGNLPVVQNNLKSSLKKVDENKTVITLETDIQLKLAGKILYPIVKSALVKGFTELTEELKHYVETGKPHPRKVAKMNKK